MLSMNLLKCFFIHFLVLAIFLIGFSNLIPKKYFGITNQISLTGNVGDRNLPLDLSPVNYLNNLSEEEESEIEYESLFKENFLIYIVKTESIKNNFFYPIRKTLNYSQKITRPPAFNS